MAVNGERERGRAVAQPFLNDFGVLALPEQMGRMTVPKIMKTGAFIRAFERSGANGFGGALDRPTFLIVPQP
jgi:hypothetical protein